MSAPAPTHIAFYGTLRRGLAQRARLGVSEALRWVGTATLRGRLLDLGAYPGLVDGTGRVVADLFAIQDAAVLGVLDRYEGADFERVVVRAGAPARPCWVYRFVGPVETAPVVHGGDWLRHVAGARRRAGVACRD